MTGRVRLKFAADLDKGDVWFMLRKSDKTIASLKESVASIVGVPSNLDLHLNGALLPDRESARILRDGDKLAVSRGPNIPPPSGPPRPQNSAKRKRVAGPATRSSSPVHLSGSDSSSSSLEQATSRYRTHSPNALRSAFQPSSDWLRSSYSTDPVLEPPESSRSPSSHSVPELPTTNLQPPSVMGTVLHFNPGSAPSEPMRQPSTPRRNTAKPSGGLPLAGRGHSSPDQSAAQASQYQTTGNGIVTASQSHEVVLEGRSAQPHKAAPRPPCTDPKPLSKAAKRRLRKRRVSERQEEANPAAKSQLFGPFTSAGRKITRAVREATEATAVPVAPGAVQELESSASRSAENLLEPKATGLNPATSGAVSAVVPTSLRAAAPGAPDSAPADAVPALNAVDGQGDEGKTPEVYQAARTFIPMGSISGVLARARRQGVLESSKAGTGTGTGTGTGLGISDGSVEDHETGKSREKCLSPRATANETRRLQSTQRERDASMKVKLTNSSVFVNADDGS